MENGQSEQQCKEISSEPKILAATVEIFLEDRYFECFFMCIFYIQDG